MYGFSSPWPLGDLLGCARNLMSSRGAWIFVVEYEMRRAEPPGRGRWTTSIRDSAISMRDKK
jgi:hypothetical protein